LPRKGRKRPDSFTLIVVPHSEKASFSVRVPFWTILVAAGLCLVGLASLVLYVLDAQETASRLAELRRGGQISMINQAELRNIIAAEESAQDSLAAVITRQATQAAQQANQREVDAAQYNDDVNQLYAQLSSEIAELEQFKADIRRIVGLDRATLEPAAAPQLGATSQGGVQPAIGPLEPLTSDRVAASVSTRGGSDSAAESVRQATADLLDNVVPQQLADLANLRQEVQDRVAKVDGQWTDPDQLSSQLSLYDASPRDWPVSGALMARFGYDARRIELGAQPFHKGVDIGSAVGAPVRAPQDGVVTFAGWNGSYGLQLEIKHNLGWGTVYGHLSSTPLKAGDRVKKGQVIGYVGMTGLTTGPHLHYEIHLNGTPVDPAKYMGK
jgi:murein DD-endopeptidase MepM/ murein hydrolase activator NlpD